MASQEGRAGAAALARRSGGRRRSTSGVRGSAQPKLANPLPPTPAHPAPPRSKRGKGSKSDPEGSNGEQRRKPGRPVTRRRHDASGSDAAASRAQWPGLKLDGEIDVSACICSEHCVEVVNSLLERNEALAQQLSHEERRRAMYESKVWVLREELLRLHAAWGAGPRPSDKVAKPMMDPHDMATPAEEEPDSPDSTLEDMVGRLSPSPLQDNTEARLSGCATKQKLRQSSDDSHQFDSAEDNDDQEGHDTAIGEGEEKEADDSSSEVEEAPQRPSNNAKVLLQLDDQNGRASNRPRRRVARPVSYREPSLRDKIRRGHQFFQFKYPDSDPDSDAAAEIDHPEDMKPRAAALAQGQKHR